MKKKQALYLIARTGSIFCFLFILFATTAALAASVTLRWDPNEATPEGYQIFARKSNQAYNYSQPAWEGTAFTCTLNNLEDQIEYYFVVRAYDGNLDSANSNEVHFIPPPLPPTQDTTPPTQDATAPSWNGATTGIGLATDSATGGSVTVAFDTASDAVDGTNLKFNVYFAASTSWNNTDWSSNSVVADAAIKSSSIFAHAVTLSGLTNNVNYTFGVRAEDQSGNEDSNTRTLKATPTVLQSASTYNLMSSARPDRSGAVYLDDAGVEGIIYVFVAPTTNIQKVEFLIDGVLKQTENVAPYDLAGTANGGLAAPFDADKLGSGYHTFSARITQTNGSRETISTDVYHYGADSGSSGTTVPAPIPVSQSAYTQWVSTAPNRSYPEALDGATVGGLIYAFVEPTTDIKRVEFLIDGVLKQTENVAPYDLAGGASTRADPFNADRLSSGYHAFSARITKTNGSSETISADVYVNDAGVVNTPPPASNPVVAPSNSIYAQWVSTAPNRSYPEALDGATVGGLVYAFVEPTTDIKRVEFFIDGVLKQTENVAPYDLAGTANGWLAAPLDTNLLTNGHHTFSAQITKTSGNKETIAANVIVE